MSGMLTWILVPFAFIAFGAFRVVRRGYEFRQLVLDGMETRGRVQTKVGFNGSGARSRYLRYEYTDPSGRRHSHRSLVTADLWNAAREGSPIAIVYSASKPSISAPKYLVDAARKAMPAKA